jgi:hypothetical protein
MIDTLYRDSAWHSSKGETILATRHMGACQGETGRKHAKEPTHAIGDIMKSMSLRPMSRRGYQGAGAFGKTNGFPAR